jgi:hypothetical protein
MLMYLVHQLDLSRDWTPIIPYFGRFPGPSCQFMTQLISYYEQGNLPNMVGATC